jgi:formylglycine-generating enzyme required for sulfatase activity
MISVCDEPSAQEKNSTSSGSEQAGMPDTGSGSKTDAASEDPDPLKTVKQAIEAWIKAHPLAALLWAIFGPVLVGVSVWIFKDILKKIVTEELRLFFKRMFTGVLIRFGRYNQLLQNYHQSLQERLKDVGLTQQLLGEGVDMEQNYIPIQLSKDEYKNPETVSSIDSADESAPAIPSTVTTGAERIEVHNALTEEKTYGNRIAIIGDPGAGKTTLIQYLAYQCTKDEGVRPIPALITSTTYVDSKVKSPRLYLETLFEENGFPKAKEFVEEQLKAGAFLILFDGFDEIEIGRRKEIRRQIEAFANNAAYLENKFVVTSRPNRDAVFDNFRHLEVMPLTPEQRRGFLESKIKDLPESDFNADRCAKLLAAIESHNGIRKLAENPLLLTFLYHVYKYNLELPRRRVELYRLSVNLMLDWDLETNRPTHIRVRDRDAKKEVLKKVAYYYHTHDRRDLSEEELIEQVSIALPDSLKAEFTPKELVREIENSSGILRHRTQESYQFIHLTFQEYLTADYISDNREEEIPKLMEVLDDSRWREVVLLLAGIMGNATPLVSHIMNYREQLPGELEKLSCTFIAFSCLSEGEVANDVRDTILDAFAALPYNQAADVIENAFGALEAENEEVETLLLNILNNPHEPVQVWGLGFLTDYPQLLKDSHRLTEHIEEIFRQPKRSACLIEKVIPLIPVIIEQASVIERGGFQEGVHDILHFADDETQKPAWQELAAIHDVQNQAVIDEYLRSLAPDGMILIPAGEFKMGSHNGEDDEKPAHTVYVDAFYMDVSPVTNAQYRKFIEAIGHAKPRYWDDERFNGENQPVVGVIWYDAMVYCEWAGKRLPTEAEWEKAARGGQVGKRFPWGDEDPDNSRANYGESEGSTTPVGKYPPNGYGLHDMAGNVWEWCLDEYQSDFYGKSPPENPLAGEKMPSVIDNFTSVKSGRVLRGGSWGDIDFNLRVAQRDVLYPVGRIGNYGFRCCSPRFRV